MFRRIKRTGLKGLSIDPFGFNPKLITAREWQLVVVAIPFTFFADEYRREIREEYALPLLPARYGLFICSKAYKSALPSPVGEDIGEGFSIHYLVLVMDH